jgi:hypothetical protein
MISTLHKFELIDTRSFRLPNEDGVMATHLATILWGMREFVYFRVDSTGKTYIEEVILKPTVQDSKIVAKYQLIEDDNLWQDLAGFLAEKGLTEIKLPYYNPFL